ncbi:hypothetical protein D3C73_1347730 [compost metagenome]
MKQFKQPLTSFTVILGSHPVSPGGKLKMFPYGQLLIQHRRLRDKSQRALVSFRVLIPGLPLYSYPAAMRSHQPENMLHRCAFPCPVQSDQANHFPRLHFEVNIMEHRAPEAVPPGQLFNLQYGRLTQNGSPSINIDSSDSSSVILQKASFATVYLSAT